VGVLLSIYEGIAKDTARLERLAEAGLSNWVELIAATRLLQTQAQGLIDLVARIASLLGHAPGSAREAVEALLLEGVVSEGEALFIKKVIGFRNVVVHEYLGIDESLIKGLVEGREFRRVASLAASLLERAAKRGLDP